VKEFVGVGTLVTLIPVLVVMAVIGLLAGLLIKALDLSWPFICLLMLLIGSPVTGRFAMAARDGQLDAGFLPARLARGVVLASVLRHATLCVAWGLPFTVAVPLLIRKGVALPAMGLAAGPLSLGGAGAAFVVLMTAAVAAQLLSLLVATRAD